ncbi:MAG: chloride channel protein [Xylophilus ampelinus]
MQNDPNFWRSLKAEFSSWRMWLDRAVVLAYAIAAGLLVVGFTMLGDGAFGWFQELYAASPWAVLAWTPALTAAIAWATRRHFPGAAGSGIPQVMVALDPALPPAARERFVSLRLSVAKIVLASAGLLAGLSIGREGPSVQVAAGVMQHARRWLGPRSAISGHALLVAGGAAGIAAAFNAPLAGVVFAIEELSRKLESHNSGLIIAAIVLSGLMAVSAFGNLSYFGVIRVPRLGWDALLPGLLVTLACAVLGGLFSRLLASSITGDSPDRFTRWRARHPVRFAAAGGLAIAVIGCVTGGATFGAGSEEVKHLLAGEGHAPAVFVALKFVATWLTAWCGVPGGIFAPSLSIGAGVGQNLATLTDPALAPALIALGMAGFLAAVTQAPLTSFIIVMEMVDGHAMVLSLMAAAMLSSLISRMLSQPLYSALASHMLQRAAEPHPGPPAPAAAAMPAASAGAGAEDGRDAAEAAPGAAPAERLPASPASEAPDARAEPPADRR